MYASSDHKSNMLASDANQVKSMQQISGGGETKASDNIYCNAMNDMRAARSHKIQDLLNRVRKQ